MKTYACIILAICLLQGCLAHRKTVIDLRGRGMESLPDSLLKDNRATVLMAGPNWVVYSPLSNTEINGGNHIISLPENICQLRHLHKLLLEYNDIRTLPVCLVKLTRLEQLDLSFNTNLNIREILPVLRQLPDLKVLNVCGVPSALNDSIWLKQQFAASQVRVLITYQDVLNASPPSRQYRRNP